MINLLLAYDEQDKKIGKQFKILADITKTIFIYDNIVELPSLYLKNNIAILEKRKEITSAVVFIAFTHGEETALIGSGNRGFLTTKTDVTAFTGDFIYSFSCLAGIHLSKYLVENGVKCFIGHNKIIYVHTLPKYSSFFEKPIKCFISNIYNRKTIEQSIQETRLEYNKQIDSLYKMDFMLASCLLNNRDSLIVFGDITTTLSEYDRQ